MGRCFVNVLSPCYHPLSKAICIFLALVHTATRYILTYPVVGPVSHYTAASTFVLRPVSDMSNRASHSLSFCS
ncbi:hypothetical protein SISSUDRAFT_252349 [Sistotremastrum suecicum HHB10207 ss-3]|uniref:Uncharacterized protein n=1 Tax=Sistotremastrum suecicum HHB10207 ss-3 TaxID=1314776 RepID=A0A165ZW15_9AGAM|nr:hypothetical protein SISSUDRAFT_252349 [Sistotremastrum suecicum HHB10207 ss-3]